MMTMRWIALPVLAMAFIACGSETEEPQPSDRAARDAAGLLGQAAQAMEDLKSFSMEFAFQANAPAVPFYADYADPGNWYERLQSPESGKATELILVGDEAYGRGCENYPSDCEPWSQASERGEGDKVPGAIAFTTTAPETLGLTALDYIENPEVTETEDDSVIHLEGNFRLGKVILENKRKVYGDVKEYRSSCRSTDLGSGNPEASPICTYTSFEEYAEEEFGDVNFDAEPAAPVHVWISARDFRVQRVVIGIPGGEPGGEPPENERYFEVSYSRFNQAVVEAPE